MGRRLLRRNVCGPKSAVEVRVDGVTRRVLREDAVRVGEGGCARGGTRLRVGGD